MQRKYKLLFFFIILLAVDQVTKLMVQGNFALYESKEVIPGFFNITFILNPGAAFGILQNQPELFRRIFFLALTLIACAVILMLIKKEFSFKLRTYAYTAVLAGAIGNAVDRIRIGKVVDFLDFYYQDFHWYTFNMADCYITVSVFVLILDMIVLNKGKF